MLEQIKKISELKLKNCKNESEKDKFTIINKILQDNDCFKKMTTETAYNLLNDLGFEIEDIKKIYNEIIF